MGKYQYIYRNPVDHIASRLLNNNIIYMDSNICINL